MGSALKKGRYAKRVSPTAAVFLMSVLQYCIAGQKTLRSGAIVAGVKMHFPDEMASHALSAGVAAVAKYTKALKAKGKKGKGSPRK